MNEVLESLEEVKARCIRTTLPEYHNIFHRLQAARFKLSRMDVETSDLNEELTSLVDITREILSLIMESRDHVKSVNFNKRARLYGGIGTGMNILDDWLAGENTAADVITDGLSFILGRLAETEYIDSAAATFHSSIDVAALNLLDRLWEMAILRRLNMGENDTGKLTGVLNDLRNLLLNQRIKAELRVQMMFFLYMVIFVLHIDLAIEMAGKLL